MHIFYFLTICLLYGCTPKYHLLEMHAQKELEMVSVQLSRKYPLELITNSSGLIADDHQARFGIGFISRSCYTMENARPLMLEVVHAFQQALACQPIFSQLIAKSHGLSQKAVAIKIAFWDSNMQRPPFPYLAQIRFSKGRLYYYYANPHTGALQAPITEELGNDFIY